MTACDVLGLYEYRLVRDDDGAAVAYRRLDLRGVWVVEADWDEVPDRLATVPSVAAHFGREVPA